MSRISFVADRAVGSSSDWKSSCCRSRCSGSIPPGGGGWNLAARFWAEARAQKPAIVFSDADLLIAATAAFHGREFLTCEPGLAEGLDRVGFPTGVRVLDRA